MFNEVFKNIQRYFISEGNFTFKKVHFDLDFYFLTHFAQLNELYLNL